MFDGSSIAGWKSIEKSDMKLMPDPTSAYVDPFYAEKTLCLHCSVLEPDTNEPYDRDPRGTAQKAEAFLKQTGIGDTSYFGPEAEFFIFDDVRFSNAPNKVSFQIDAIDAAWNTDTVYEMGNMGHRAGVKGGYFPVPPVDAAQDIRSEMLSTMKRMGMKVDKHHHEVASPQHELGLIFGTLTAQADNLLKYKYVIQQRRARLRQDRDLHAEALLRRQRLGHARQHVDLEGQQAGLRRRQVRRPLRRGALVHRRAPEARQDDQRLHQPDDQQLQAADPGLRGAGAARLLGAQPLGLGAHPLDREPEGQARRVPLPRPLRQPLPRLRGAADGRHRRHPQQDRPRARPRTRTSTTCRPRSSPRSRRSAARLREALECLEADHEFLLHGDVFTKGQIEGYIALKWPEVYMMEHTPHPVEYQMYYSL